jgi:hypothetical protein
MIDLLMATLSFTFYHTASQVMIECDDNFELNLSFGGSSGAAKKKPKVSASAPPRKEKVMLRRNPTDSDTTTAPLRSSSASSLGGARTPSDGGGEKVGGTKSLRRAPDPSTGKINTTTGLLQHKVPVVGNKVKSSAPLTHKQKQKQAAAAARALKSETSSTATATATTSASGADHLGSSSSEKEKEIEVFEDPMQYHARPKDLSKDAGSVKEVSRSEYIFTRQSFSALKMPVKVVELLEKDVANGE